MPVLDVRNVLPRIRREEGILTVRCRFAKHDVIAGILRDRLIRQRVVARTERVLLDRCRHFQTHCLVQYFRPTRPVIPEYIEALGIIFKDGYRRILSDLRLDLSASRLGALLKVIDPGLRFRLLVQQLADFNLLVQIIQLAPSVHYCRRNLSKLVQILHVVAGDDKIGLQLDNIFETVLRYDLDSAELIREERILAGPLINSDQSAAKRNHIGRISQGDDPLRVRRNFDRSSLGLVCNRSAFSRGGCCRCAACSRGCFGGLARSWRSGCCVIVRRLVSAGC
ncbi:hypothetical protein D3C81_1280430 [compost metagenome]